MRYLIVVNTSTMATKALLMDEVGSVVAVGAHEYAYETPFLLWN